MLVVRAWVEDFPEGTLRARITQTLDIALPGEVVTVTSSVDELCAAVRAWLEAFLDGRDWPR